MVPERLDESIALLKEILLWFYKDVVYLKLNLEDKAKKSTISDESREILKELLWACCIIIL